MPSVARNGSNGKSYAFAPVFEATSAKSLTNVFRGMVEEDPSNASFMTKVEKNVEKVARDVKPNGDLMGAFANRCEEKDLKVAFNLFDVDGDGYLNREEMLSALKALGEGDVELPKNVMRLDLKTFERMMR